MMYDKVLLVSVLFATFVLVAVSSGFTSMNSVFAAVTNSVEVEQVTVDIDNCLLAACLNVALVQAQAIAIALTDADLLVDSDVSNSVEAEQLLAQVNECVFLTECLNFAGAQDQASAIAIVNT